MPFYLWVERKHQAQSIWLVLYKNLGDIGATDEMLNYKRKFFQMVLSPKYNSPNSELHRAQKKASHQIPSAPWRLSLSDSTSTVSKAKGIFARVNTAKWGPPSIYISLYLCCQVLPDCQVNLPVRLTDFFFPSTQSFEINAGSSGTGTCPGHSDVLDTS